MCHNPQALICLIVPKHKDSPARLGCYRALADLGFGSCSSETLVPKLQNYWLSCRTLTVLNSCVQSQLSLVVHAIVWG